MTSVGSTLLVLILFKYIRTQRVTARHMRRSGWWQPGSEHSQQPSSLESGSNMESSNASSGRSSRYDRALITRFSIAFILLAYALKLMSFLDLRLKLQIGFLKYSWLPFRSLKRTAMEPLPVCPVLITHLEELKSTLPASFLELQQV